MSGVIFAAIALVVAFAAGMAWFRVRSRRRSLAATLWSQAGPDAGLPVRAAVTLSAVDARAVAALERAVRALAAGPSARLDSMTPAEPLGHVVELLVDLAGDADGWHQGASVLWSDREPGVGSSAGVLTLAGVPQGLQAGGASIEAFAHTARFAAELDAPATAFLEHVEQELVAQPTQREADDDRPLRAALGAEAASKAGIRWLAEAIELATGLCEPLDPHAEERVLLGETMRQLGLTDEATTLPSKQEYIRRFVRYDETLLASASGFAHAVEVELQARRAVLVKALGAPPGLTAAAAKRRHEITTELQDARTAYVAALKAMLATARGLTGAEKAPETTLADAATLLAAAEQQLALSRKELGLGNVTAALAQLTATPLPSDASWWRSRAYHAACSKAASALRQVTDEHRRQLRAWLQHTLEQLPGFLAASSDAVETSASTYRERRERNWTQLRQAAEALQLDAARTLAGPEVRCDLALPVRGAAALVTVDAAAAGELARAAERLRGEPIARLDSAAPATHLGRVVDVLDRFAQDAAGWVAGAGRLWGSGGTGVGLSKDVLRLAGVPERLRANGISIDEYVHAQSRARGLDRGAIALLESIERGVSAAAPVDGPADRNGLWDLLAPGHVVPDAGPMSRVRALARGLCDPPDPHSEKRVLLEQTMRDLGLTDDATTLAAKEQYTRQRDRYEERLLATASGFACAVDVEVHARRVALVKALGEPPALSPAADMRVRELAITLDSATTAYAEQLRALISSAASLVGSDATLANAGKRLSAVEQRLSPARKQLRRGDCIAALQGLAAAPLPVESSWQPARAYEAVCTATASALTEVTDERRKQLCGWLERTIAHAEESLTATSSAVATAVEAYVEQRERTWTEHEQAAEQLKLDAARALASVEARESDAGLPVRGAVALAIVDANATARLGKAFGELVPEPRRPGTDDGVDDHLKAVEDTIATLERNSIGWAAANALLMQLADPGGVGGAALSQSMAGMAAVPEHLVHAASDLFSFLHGSFPQQVSEAVGEFITNSINDITPDFSHAIQPQDNLISGLFHLVSTTKDSLLAELATNPDSGVEHFLGTQGLHTAMSLARHVEHAPQVQDAMGQLAQAGHLSGAAALHGVLGHVPVFTLVISSAREMRRLSAAQISKGEAIANVAVDTVGVGAGVTGAAMLGAALGLHGGPLFFVTVPAGMLSAVLTHMSRRYRDRVRYTKAVAAYAVADDRFRLRQLELARGLSTSIRSAVEKERKSLKHGSETPVLLDHAASEHLQALATALHKAGAAYVGQCSSLLAFALEREGRGQDGSLRAALMQVRAVEKAVAVAGERLQNSQFLSALATLTETAVPVPKTWAPADAYASLCASTAQRLQQLSDQQRERVGAWAAETTTTFERAKAAIAKRSDSAITTFNSELELALQPVKAAAEAVKVAQAPLLAH